MTRLAILDYGFGNLRSVERAVDRVGGEGLITRDPDEVERSDALVVPGVGAFGACVTALRSLELDRVITGYVDSGRPVFGVCLGMQVLFERGEEGPADGLGILRGPVRRLPGGLRVPHMGWNEVEWTEDHPLHHGISSGSRFYFVHSFVCHPDNDVVAATTDYGGPFASAVAAGNVFATQFHPEKSGEAGLEMYRNLVKEAG